MASSVTSRPRPHHSLEIPSWMRSMRRSTVVDLSTSTPTRTTSRDPLVRLLPTPSVVRRPTAVRGPSYALVALLPAQIFARTSSSNVDQTLTLDRTSTTLCPVATTPRMHLTIRAECGRMLAKDNRLTATSDHLGSSWDIFLPPTPAAPPSKLIPTMKASAIVRPRLLPQIPPCLLFPKYPRPLRLTLLYPWIYRASNPAETAPTMSTRTTKIAAWLPRAPMTSYSMKATLDWNWSFLLVERIVSDMATPQPSERSLWAAECILESTAVSGRPPLVATSFSTATGNPSRSIIFTTGLGTHPTKGPT
mmetsp:Transcript_4330/g.10338  ORF Transcript_4330/g.10338 Transcript_4330/m.10338 type:complete len:306 (+) Transcript_4330:1697-2614(+)